MIAPPRFPISEPFGGGLEAQVWHTCAELHSRGIEVELYGAVGSDFAAPGLSFPLPDWGSTPHLASDTTLPPATARSHGAVMNRLLDQLARNERGYDLVHNQCLYPEPVARAGELPVPVVSTLHTPPLQELIDVLPGHSGTFVAVSRFVRDAWTMLDRPAEVIHNGIDVARWPAGPGGEHLAWFGRIVPEKAPHLAIDAATAAGRPLVLAGRVGDVEYFESEVRPRLSERVRFVGELRQSRIAEIVGQCAAVLVTPMWPEPFGLVAAEAAACGTPVIAFAAGGLTEVVAEGVTGVTVPQGDVAAMAAAVPWALDLDRGRVREASVRRFGVAAMTDRYLALYDSLIGLREEESA